MVLVKIIVKGEISGHNKLFNTKMWPDICECSALDHATEIH